MKQTESNEMKRNIEKTYSQGILKNKKWIQNRVKELSNCVDDFPVAIESFVI